MNRALKKVIRRLQSDDLALNFVMVRLCLILCSEYYILRQAHINCGMVWSQVSMGTTFVNPDNPEENAELIDIPCRFRVFGKVWFFSHRCLLFG